MSRSFDSALVQCLEYVGAPLSAYPFTIAAWVWSVHMGNHAIVGIRDDAIPGYGDNSMIVYLSSVSNARFMIDQNQAISTTSYTNGKWEHICGVAASNLSRIVYINGGGKNEDTANETFPPNLGVLRIGACGQGGTTIPFDGLIAHVSIWARALNDAEVLSLLGALPTEVHPEDLIAYWPLKTNDYDYIGSAHLTPVNSPTFSTLDPFPPGQTGQSPQSSKGLPVPFLDYVPKIFRDNPSPDLLAFSDKMDELLGAWGKETKGLQRLFDPARAPVTALGELGFMFQAGFKGYETERQKRQKIGFAVKGHKSRGLWREDAKPKIDAIAGGDAQILRWFSGDDWILVGDGLTPAGFYWATLGADGIDDELGLALLGSGDEMEVVGNIYIDVDNDSLTAQQVENMVQELEADVVPAYIRVILGYVNVGGQFIEYARI